MTAAIRRGRGKSARNIELIETAREILAEIQPASVRAVCYQLFIRNLIPNMGKNATARVSEQLTWAREQEIIPWHWIVDEARSVERVSTWDDPEAYQAAVIRSYRRDAWQDQPCRLEVWSEKGTHRGTLAPILNRYAVPFRVMHGFASATVVNDIAEQTQDSGQPLRVLYIGDWDPSGLYMSEVDLGQRLSAYGAEDYAVTRIALIEDDVAFGDLPPFRVEEKVKDARFRWYVERYGDRCWEVDALSLAILRERVEAGIEAWIDRPLWERTLRVERAELDSLKAVMGTWKAAHP